MISSALSLILARLEKKAAVLALVQGKSPLVSRADRVVDLI